MKEIRIDTTNETVYQENLLDTEIIYIERWAENHGIFIEVSNGRPVAIFSYH